jgi:osmotically inducible protein OsmC
MKRSATAIWEGNGKSGKGNLSTESGLLSSANYSYKTRFDNDKGTNPEELIAAAHAGCFCMKLSFVLQEAGYVADELKARCEISLEDGKITISHIRLEAIVPEMEEKVFAKYVKEAKENCPVSKALNIETKVLYVLKA